MPRKNDLEKIAEELSRKENIPSKQPVAVEIVQETAEKEVFRRTIRTDPVEPIRDEEEITLKLTRTNVEWMQRQYCAKYGITLDQAFNRLIGETARERAFTNEIQGELKSNIRIPANSAPFLNW